MLRCAETAVLLLYYKSKPANVGVCGGEGGGAAAGSYTRRGNLWDLVVLNLWNLNVDESYHRDCPVLLGVLDLEAEHKHHTLIYALHHC